ncbi:MAG: DUF362 domain-containing protein [Thiotrichales bacterium]
MQERVFIVDDPALTATERLDTTLERADFWDCLESARIRSELASAAFTIVIKPDLEAFAADSPTATDPRLVEHLIERLHQRGYTAVNVGASADSAYFWAENREVAVLADLIGYRYVTAGGAEYDVLDLGQDRVPGGFAEGDALRGSDLAAAWRDAAFRISFASNKTDEREGYALGLHGLLGALPLADKDYYYRQRLASGDAIAELLAVTPVDFALIDAVISAHGSGGGRDPCPLTTNCILAGRHLALVDFIGALKMGLDPYCSPLCATVFRRHGLPAAYAIKGNLAPYAGWKNPSPVVLDSHRRRERLPVAHRLVTPWLQRLDPELFPPKRVLDARMNPPLSQFFSATDENPSAAALLTFANYAIGAIGDWLNAYRVLYDKDALRPIQVPLGFDPSAFEACEYAAIRPELDQLETLLGETAPATPNLCWREIDGATVFRFERELAIPFEAFIARVDVARTIQFMNDYIGGVVIPTLRDREGRVLHQAERNLYLPQPNYLVLYQGQPIDVSKIEICDYGDDQQRMYWKTIKSENNSATHDDGVVYFCRSAHGTRVRIVGKQQFTLPPFWQAIDLNLMPDLKRALVTHAYETFFQRTIANFEALVEGREIRIGRPWQPARDSLTTEPLPGAALEQWALGFAERYEPLLMQLGNAAVTPGARPDSPPMTDDDGFRHFVGAPSVDSASDTVNLALNHMGNVIGEFLRGLSDAVARDLADGTRGPS